ncbi:hypothetical protein PPERSA_00793 [Pseudocohnilembus persalinus]|uniref:Uncharacterized protein n=1 Tax=Pseudocohnilembus persalinus TaxID=266149 RepID=A0A0V0QG70_PSEPJ|nr:hypothetical protein PPERSA_00793 [Pseudocohnilembus persalinus]|eukprot:KRX01045.1 hypothetical protein PPERSA_00793 [Pseudocohnilembus persalinus]
MTGLQQLRIAKLILSKGDLEFMILIQDQFSDILFQLASQNIQEFKFTSQNDQVLEDKGYGELEKIINSILIFSLESLYVWSKWYPTQHNSQSMSKFQKKWQQLQQKGRKIPQNFKFYNQNSIESFQNQLDPKGEVIIQENFKQLIKTIFEYDLLMQDEIKQGEIRVAVLDQVDRIFDETQSEIKNIIDNDFQKLGTQTQINLVFQIYQNLDEILDLNAEFEQMNEQQYIQNYQDLFQKIKTDYKNYITNQNSNLQHEDIKEIQNQEIQQNSEKMKINQPINKINIQDDVQKLNNQENQNQEQQMQSQGSLKINQNEICTLKQNENYDQVQSQAKGQDCHKDKQNNKVNQIDQNNKDIDQHQNQNIDSNQHINENCENQDNDQNLHRHYSQEQDQDLNKDENYDKNENENQSYNKLNQKDMIFNENVEQSQLNDNEKQHINSQNQKKSGSSSPIQQQKQNDLSLQQFQKPIEQNTSNILESNQSQYIKIQSKEQKNQQIQYEEENSSGIQKEKSDAQDLLEQKNQKLNQNQNEDVKGKSISELYQKMGQPQKLRSSSVRFNSNYQNQTSHRSSSKVKIQDKKRESNNMLQQEKIFEIMKKELNQRINEQEQIIYQLKEENQIQNDNYTKKCEDFNNLQEQYIQLEQKYINIDKINKNTQTDQEEEQVTNLKQKEEDAQISLNLEGILQKQKIENSRQLNLNYELKRQVNQIDRENQFLKENIKAKNKVIEQLQQTLKDMELYEEKYYKLMEKAQNLETLVQNQSISIEKIRSSPLKQSLNFNNQYFSSIKQNQDDTINHNNFFETQNRIDNPQEANFTNNFHNKPLEIDSYKNQKNNQKQNKEKTELNKVDESSQKYYNQNKNNSKILKQTNQGLELEVSEIQQFSPQQSIPQVELLKNDKDFIAKSQDISKVSISQIQYSTTLASEKQSKQIQNQKKPMIYYNVNQSNTILNGFIIQYKQQNKNFQNQIINIYEDMLDKNSEQSQHVENNQQDQFGKLNIVKRFQANDTQQDQNTQLDKEQEEEHKFQKFILNYNPLLFNSLNQCKYFVESQKNKFKLDCLQQNPFTIYQQDCIIQVRTDIHSVLVDGGDQQGQQLKINNNTTRQIDTTNTEQRINYLKIMLVISNRNQQKKKLYNFSVNYQNQNDSMALFTKPSQINEDIDISQDIQQEIIMIPTSINYFYENESYPHNSVNQYPLIQGDTLYKYYQDYNQGFIRFENGITIFELKNIQIKNHLIKQQLEQNLIQLTQIFRGFQSITPRTFRFQESQNVSYQEIYEEYIAYPNQIQDSDKVQKQLAVEYLLQTLAHFLDQ